MSGFSSSHFIQTSRRRILLRDKPLWMAIINATPDSFSDGGREDVVGHAMKCVRDGADILDIGGESTRPGAEPVSPETEIGRVIPVIQGIFAKCDEHGIHSPPISVDTRHPETSRAALAAGAELINDVTGGENSEMRRLAADTGAAFCFMHMRGTPRNMQKSPTYENVVEEIFAYLTRQRDLLLASGVHREQLIADPGIGFGKTAEHNLEILRNITRFRELGVPVMVGHSRKKFLEKIFGVGGDAGTEIVSRMMAEAGVEVLRLHVKPDSPAENRISHV